MITGKYIYPCSDMHSVGRYAFNLQINRFMVRIKFEIYRIDIYTGFSKEWTVLQVQILYYRFKYCTTGSDTVLQFQILYYRYRYCTTGSDTVLQVQILYYRYRYCTIGTDTVL